MQPQPPDGATIRAMIAKAERAFAAGPHPERARRDAETLLLHLFPHRNRAWLIAHTDETLSDDQASRFAVLIERRSSGEPIQHITGEQEFYGLPFRVTSDVLIPRPETEHLIEKALALAASFARSDNSFSPPSPALKGRGFSPYIEPSTSAGALAPGRSASKISRIVDVGTGSGAIAVAIAHHLPDAQLTAVDISTAALSIARENAQSNGVADRIRFLQSDLLAAVANERFDIVVSNPPYVPTTDRDSLSVEVREHEPALALFAGGDGLDIYRRLVPDAFAVLEPGGYLLMEIGYGQSAKVAMLLKDAGFEKIEFVPDLQGIPRVACVRRP